MISKVHATIGLLFLTIGLTFNAYAQSVNPSLDEAFSVRLGPFFANLDTKFAVQGQEFTTTDRLNDSETTFALYGQWRISPRFQLRVGYSQISNDDSETLGSSVSIGGFNVPGGTTLSQDYETSTLPISLGWAFLKNPTTEFGLDVGVNVTSIKQSLSVTIPGTGTTSLVNEDVTEPLPSIGLFWNQAINQQWVFSASGRYMGLEIGDIDADILDLFAGVEWRPWRNFGIGGAYLFNKADGTVGGSGSSTDFEYQYDGPFAYIVIGSGSP